MRLPDVDWSRYNQQVLFVDRHDTVRARMAAGMLDIATNWNGMDLAVVLDRCGVDAEPSGYMDPSRAASLLSMAQASGVSSRHFTRQFQCFEVDDFYRYDVIIALDTGVLERLMSAAEEEAASALTPGYLQYFQSKTARLSDFSGWCSDAELTREGGTALLPRSLSGQLAPGLAEARGVVDIPRPDLSSPEAYAQWDAMKCSILLGNAGLLQYLKDSWPKDMPHWSEPN